MKRCFPYLISFQQVLCGYWIKLVLVQAFLPGMLSLSGCALFFILQWGLSLLNQAKKPALRLSLLLLNIGVFAILLPNQKEMMAIILTGVGLILETGLLLSLQQTRDCSWGKLGIGGLILIVVNIVSASPALIRSSLLCALAALCLRVQSQFINPSDPASLNHLDPDQGKLLFKLMFIQLTATLVIGPLSTILLAITRLLSQGLTWILSLLIETFAFVFSAIILSLQSLIRWILAHQKDAGSSLQPSQPEATMAPSLETEAATSPVFNGILTCLLVIAVGFVLFFLLRWLYRMIRKSRSPSLAGGFHSEKINVSAQDSPVTLRQRLHAWLHPEVLSPIRKQYKEAVQVRIQKGHPFAPQMTPWEYWRQVQADEPDDQFENLTKAYNQERYQP